MAKISKLNLNGSIYDIGSKAANVLFDDNKSVDETRVLSVAFTEEDTGVKLELKDKDGSALCSDSIDLAKTDKAGVVVIDSEMKKDTATKKVTSTNSPTSKAVADYIENELGDLAGAMVFKGGVSSTAALPTACKAGDTYIVQEEGTYAGKALKVGDMLIANKDKESGAAAADWTPVSPTPKVEDKQATIGTEDTVIAVVDGQEITVKNEFDDELDEDSENAVQNKVVKEELEKKAEIVEIATSAGAAKLTLAAIKDLKNPQFQYQGKDIQAIKISDTECLWQNIDDEGYLWQYKQTSTGLTATRKQIAFMNNKDGQTDDNKKFYSDANHVKYGMSGGVYFDDYEDTGLYPTRVFMYADEDWDDDTQYMLNVYQDGFKNIKLEGIACPIWGNLAANKDYVDRQELWKTGAASPYTCKLTNADLFKDVNNNRRYMFKGIDVSYKSNPTATKAEFFYIDGNEEHTLVIENNKITDTVEKLAQLNEIDVLKTGQEQKLVVKFVDSSAGDVTFAAGTYYDANDKKVKNYKNEGSTPTLKLSETPSPNVIYLDDLTKKLYQWNPTTELMVEIPTGGDTLIQILYADLVNLKNTKKLVPGTKYRIIDFVTTATSDNMLGHAVTSALHPFDVVVTALSNEILDENATAMLHDGDTYFAGQKITSWDIKYCLANDISRFAWANPTGKGVIFYMKDENSNEASYDFKNILQDGRFTFGDTADKSLVAYNNFENVIHPTYGNDGALRLTEVIMGDGCQLNEVGAWSLGIYLLAGSAINKIGNMCSMITIEESGRNTFVQQCSGISLGEGCNDNTFKIGCNDISLINGCVNNVFGEGCDTINIGENSCNNTFGVNCSDLSLGDGWCNVKFGDDCSSIKFFNADQTTDFIGIFKNSEIASGTGNVGFAFTVGDAAAGLNIAERVHIHDGFHPDTFTIYDIDVTQFPNSSQIEVALDSEENYIVWNDADVAMLLKYCDFIPFKSDVDYDEGQHVTYKGKLYQFNQDHPAGAWDADHVDVTSVRQQLNHMYELEKVLTTSVVDLQTRLADIEDYLP